MLLCYRAMFFFVYNEISERQDPLQLPDHDLTVEAAWPQLFLDHKGKYWDVPESLSVDLSSLLSPSGLRYHVGIHKNGGNPQQVNAMDGNLPLSLLPGLCVKTAISYEKIKYLWRDKGAVEQKNEEVEQVNEEMVPYDVLLKEPHSAVSGMIGNFSRLFEMRISMFYAMCQSPFEHPFAIYG